MTFNELTRVMLSNMDFFELRRTAARYAVPYQGVRRSKLLRDLERKITLKHSQPAVEATIATPGTVMSSDEVKRRERAARSKPDKQNAALKINTYVSGNATTRVYDGK